MGIDMLSIGEIAYLTGVSRRMLRHWEAIGLLAPATVDERTGYRRYSRTQVGRVRAVSALRAVGFSLVDVRDLLDHAHVTEDRLVELLRTRERELVAQVAEASARLVEVRGRLDAIERGRDTIMSTLRLEPLPPLHLPSLRQLVSDESEIGEAVSDLLPRVREELAARGTVDSDVVLTYDGGSDPDAIVVTVGAVALDVDGPRWPTVSVPGAERGVSVRFATPPRDIGDAWTSVDARLEADGLETTGTYRQVLTPSGEVVLRAPVRERTGPH